MVKVRQDAWSHEDDLLLAETVLRHIREGSTQLNAFEEVGDALNRTSAACGFRWNAEVRNNYIDAIEVAKKQRKQLKRTQASTKKYENNNHNMIEYVPDVFNKDDSPYTASNPFTQNHAPMTLKDVIAYLQSLLQDEKKSMHAINQSDKLQAENQHLLNKVTDLEKELNEKEKRLETVEEDYRTFIQIMDRARKMTVLEDQQTEQAPKFRMDKNGNLEQVIQSHTN